ncbi:MAG: peptide MFS transporter [Bacteroidales bacterium]|nr:peptide MFS transporter [Bacteroidales bacterium]
MLKGHPKGLLAAALSNMGERFGYYIMNAVLVLFLCSKFGLPDEKATAIYSVFYAGIYVLNLVGGIIADRRQNYKGTIMSGLIVMAAGYLMLSVPIMTTQTNISWLLPFTCFALFCIAFGNGLFKGNLQAIVGQMYDNFEVEAAKEGPDALRIAKEKRDSGFQIFYVFINIGGLIAPFVAPLLRSWWLGQNGFEYNASLPALCHEYINNAGAVTAEVMGNLQAFAANAGVAITESVQANLAACRDYLEVFNTGIHYSFIASVLAMLISLTIFICTKNRLPNPAKKASVTSVEYTAEEKAAMAKELKQRLYALFAVLGIAVFFWFSFHQNGTSMSLFARDFVDTSSIAPEIWQAVNPFFVIVLTPIIMAIFGALARKGKEISTPRKIAIGMGIAALAYLFMSIFCNAQGYPSATDFKALGADAVKAGWWVLIVYYFFMTVAELFISPLGLSFVSKVAPKNLLGLCQGLWLGATAVGNGLLWIGPLMYNKWPVWICWAVFFSVCLISMLVMFGMVKWLERVTK